MITSTTIAWLGGMLVVIFTFAFVRVIQVRIQSWNQEKIPPLPLEDVYTITSWIGSLIGLTIMFTGVLETFAFSALNSFMASFLLALATGIPMWSVVRSLLKEVQSGELKEIVPGQFE